MKITFEISDNSNQIMKRKFAEYRKVSGNNVDLKTFSQIVFLNGLINMYKNESDVYRMIVRDGEIIEYR